MYDSTFGVDVGADRAVVAVQENAGWGTIGVDLDDFPNDLVSRVGDRQPCVRLVEGGGFRLRPAHEMYVDAVERALVVAGARLHRPVEGPVGLAVPSWWTERAASWTLGALTARGLANLRLVNAAEAAVIGARASGVELPPTVVVVDLGARSCSATVVAEQGRRTSVVPGTNAVHLEGGETLDRLVLHLVVANLDGLGTTLDAKDPDHIAAATTYLEHCQEIRHELSIRSAITATPNLAGSEHRLRIVREEFEELVESWRNEVIRIAHVAVAQSPRPVEAVLLVGGLSRTPLIGQAMSAALDLEVHGVPEPDLVVAYGAARAANVQDEPESLWARSRARFSRSWLRRPASRAIPAPSNTPLALPPGSGPVPAEGTPGVLIEQIPNEPIALGPPEVELEVEQIVEPIAVEQVLPEPEPTAEPTAEPVAGTVAEAPEQLARDEAVLDLVQAFVPTQRTPGDDRVSEFAGLRLVGSQWVRVPAAAEEEDEGPDETPDGTPDRAPAAEVPDPAPAGEPRAGRRRRRTGRRAEAEVEMAGLDALFEESRSDHASSGLR